MSKLHYNWWEGGQLLETTINPPLEVLAPQCGRIYKIIYGKLLNKRQYNVTIGNLLTCIYLDFVTMVSISLSQ
jgi:hypothetical protein